ncbi:hypothetical protein GCM10027049_05160 [Mucilaginibacter puniceus]
MKPSSRYPGFDYEANQLSKYLSSAGVVTILLKNGEIIHYTAADKHAFRQWLTDNNIEDITIDK